MSNTNEVLVWFDNEYLYMHDAAAGLFMFLGPKYATGIQYIKQFNFAECTLTARFDVAYYDASNNLNKGYCDATINIGAVLETMGYSKDLLINVDKHYHISGSRAYLLNIELKPYKESFLISVTYLKKPELKAVFSINNLQQPVATTITDMTILRHISEILWGQRMELLQAWKNKHLYKLCKEMPQEIRAELEKEYKDKNKGIDSDESTDIK